MNQTDSPPNQNINSNFIDEIHPVIRVIFFLVFSGFVSLADISQLLTGILLLSVLYCLTDLAYLKSAFVMMRRMRWFFLSIFIIYAWMTPGQTVAIPVISVYETWLPTIEGITSGIMRAVSLMLILLAVNLLLHCTSRQQLIMAIYWLAAPLRMFEISPERISVRIALVIDMLDEVQRVVSDAFAEVKGTVKSLDHIGDFATRVFRDVIYNAENTRGKTVTLHDYYAPQAAQWLLPVALWCIFISTELLLK